MKEKTLLVKECHHERMYKNCWKEFFANGIGNKAEF